MDGILIEGVTLTILDKTYRYVVIDPDEITWIFSYEKSDYIINSEGEEGWLWQAYYIRPGSFIVSSGPRSEEDISRFLDRYSHKLDSNDKLDMALFLRKGGLEEFLKKNHKEVVYDESSTRSEPNPRTDPW